MRFKFEFANSSDFGKTLIIEPWAEEFSLPRDAIITVAVEAPDYRTPQILIKDEYVIFYAWAGAVAGVYDHEKLISGNSLKNPVPYI